MNVPTELRYTREHEWIALDGDMGTVGITDYAQNSLGDVVFVELPQEGAELQANHSFGSVESVKAVSEVYSPVSGSVVEVNQLLLDAPEVLNRDPYGKGWLVRVQLKDPAEVENLLSAEAYSEFLGEES